ncbi:Protein of unknown function [Gryllus bimaculatus]|nr:Protein of unknown function [Gryllus bimaculatus]
MPLGIRGDDRRGKEREQEGDKERIPLYCIPHC